MNRQDITFEEFIAQRFGGILCHGSHEPDGQACILEAESQYRGLPWSDSPEPLDLPDIRPLNDATWPDDASRTAAMLRLRAALVGWRTIWTEGQRVEFVRRVAYRTITDPRILPAALRAAGMMDNATACEAAADLAAARDAAGAARAAARAAARDAWGAGDAARDAAWAAGAAGAARASILSAAVDIWCEEAGRVKGKEGA